MAEGNDNDKAPAVDTETVATGHGEALGEAADTGTALMTVEHRLGWR